MSQDGTIYSNTEEIKIAGLYLQNGNAWFYKPIGSGAITQLTFAFKGFEIAHSEDYLANIPVN